MNNLHKYIKDNLKTKPQFTTKELTDLLCNFNPSAAKNTHSWKIYQLVQEDFIFKVGRGLYSFKFKPIYQPELSLKAKRLHNRVKPFCSKDLVVWETIMLNEFTSTNVEHHWFFLHTAKEELESLFENLLDFSKKSFLQPDKEIIERYASNKTTYRCTEITENYFSVLYR